MCESKTIKTDSVSECVVFCWVPYVMKQFKDVEHRCGDCGVLLATWHESDGAEVHVFPAK
jgi:LITAF-like zinc ribbon domain